MSLTEQSVALSSKHDLDAVAFESLFTHMLNGVAYCRMIFERGTPIDFIYLYTNPAFATQTGLTDVIGKRVTEVIPGIEKSDTSLFDVYGRVSKTRNSERFEMYIAALGEWFDVSVYSPLEDHFVAVFDVITARKELEIRLESQANTDYLTGLPNRRHFFEQATMELARVKRHAAPLSMAMIDLDNFKTINDTFGHEIGDRVLLACAKTFAQSLREIDLVGRIGGEEFAMLFPQTTEAEALDVMERMRSAIAQLEIPMERGLPIGITISIGIAAFNGNDANIDVLLHRADQALYEAKIQGRNRTVCFLPAPKSP